MSDTEQKKPSRRGFVFGAATAGAAAAAVVALPKVQEVAMEPAAPAALPERGGGYQLSDHVKKYYSTTRT
ncbi:MAG: twin-arginine translocation signal domain-containing protein [Pseudomonadota bacterium]